MVRKKFDVCLSQSVMYGALERTNSEDMENDQTVIISQQPPSITRDVLGYQRKTLSALRWKEWVFMVVSCISLLTVIGMTIQRIIQFSPTRSKIDDPTDFAFALVLLINAVFCLYYVFSGILRERLFEIYMYIASVLVITLYIVIQFAVKKQDNGENDPLKIARLILVLILAPVNLVLAILVVRSFGWLEFRVVGASETIQKMYRQRSFLFSIVMFDMQASASFITLALSNGTSTSTVTWIIFGLGLPFTFLWSASTNLAVRREFKWLCIVVSVLGVLVPLYVLVHIIRLYTEYDVTQLGKNFLIISTIATGGLAILLRFICLLELWFTAKNFGRGLRDEALNFEAITYDIHRVKDLCTCAF